MAGGTNQWPPNGRKGFQPGFVPGGPDDPAMGGGQGGGWGGNYDFRPKQAVMPQGWDDPNSPNYVDYSKGKDTRLGMGGGWGGPTQWAGPNAQYPNWNDDPSSGFANDVAMINAGPWPGGGGGGWGGPWTGGGGGFGPGLINGDGGYGWHVADGPGSGMWDDRPPMRTFDFQDSNNNGVDDRDEPGYEYTRPGDEGYVGGTPVWDSEVEEGGGAASPFNWGSVGAGRLSKAKEYAALGQMGRAKDVFTSGDKGGAWSPEIHQQLRTFKTGG